MALTRPSVRRAAIVWIAGLVLGSLQPYRLLANNQNPSIPHRIQHAVTFGVAALLLFLLSQSGKQEWLAGLIVFCLAVAIETAQHLLYRNRFEWWDVRDDTIGLLVAALLIRRTRLRSRLLSG